MTKVYEKNYVNDGRNEAKWCGVSSANIVKCLKNWKEVKIVETNCKSKMGCLGTQFLRYMYLIGQTFERTNLIALESHLGA